MQKPYQVNILFAGFDEKAGPSLYWMDYLATMHKMNIAGNGYGRSPFAYLSAQVLAPAMKATSILYAYAGSYFVLAMLDKLWHPNLTEAEALELHIKGIDEVKNRLVVAPPDFIIKVQASCLLSSGHALMCSIAAAMMKQAGGTSAEFSTMVTAGSGQEWCTGCNTKLS